jgi:hypothetical protein
MATPDYHFLYLDAALGADWLFISARRYWQKFQPIVITDLEFVSYVYRERGKRTAITTLARRDVAPKIAEEIKKRFPNVFHDPLVYDFAEEMRITLDGRTDYNQRFGVPE